MIATLSDSEKTVAEIVEGTDRDGIIKAIKAALQTRSGKTWSVTGGKGTSWGWITINAPPARRTWTHLPKAGMGDCPPPGSEYWEPVDTGEPGHSMSPAESEELARLLGKDQKSWQGESIPASSEHRREYLHRAMFGTPGTFNGQPYWD